MALQDRPMDAPVTFGPPLDPEDSQHGEYWMIRPPLQNAPWTQILSEWTPSIPVYRATNRVFFSAEKCCP